MKHDIKRMTSDEWSEVGDLIAQCIDAADADSSYTRGVRDKAIEMMGKLRDRAVDAGIKAKRVRKTRVLVKGDYVLATKFSDGDPCDHFYVGFFREMLDDRYLVEDEKGELARRGGFRRCERISQEVGNALVSIMPIIGDKPGKSVWWWRRHVKYMRWLKEHDSKPTWEKWIC